MEQLTCAFSGHRPEKLPWGTDESDPRCVALKIQMERELRRLCEAGVGHFMFGMARGTDQYFLDVLTALRESYPLKITAAVPCRYQQKLWPQPDKRRYLTQLGKCDEIRVLEDAYSHGCMLRRNRYMVEHADMLMTVYDGLGGGTGATVAYARARGLKIISLWR